MCHHLFQTCMNRTIATDFHRIIKNVIKWKSMATANCLVTNISSLCSTEDRNSHRFGTSGDLSKLWHSFQFWMNYPFKMVWSDTLPDQHVIYSWLVWSQWFDCKPGLPHKWEVIAIFSSSSRPTVSILHCFLAPSFMCSSWPPTTTFSFSPCPPPSLNTITSIPSIYLFTLSSLRLMFLTSP